MREVFIALIVVGTAACSLQGQTFINLDFEQAVVQPNDPNFGRLDWGLAVPGWSHSTGVDTEIVYYGSAHLGASQYFLLVDHFTYGQVPLQFFYSLAFASGFDSIEPQRQWVNAYIEQTGLIPDSARSLRFQATGNFAVALNNNQLSIYSLGGNRYAADVSAYAGTVSELKILNTSGYLDLTPALVDAFAFSSTPVPEPHVFGIAAVAVLAVCTRWRWRP